MTPHLRDRRVTERGYVDIYAPGHPRARKSGWVFEHILVAERALGHYLPRSAVLHHVDGDKQGNRFGNLVVCENQTYHLLLHRRQRALQECGDPCKAQCYYCRGWNLPSEMAAKAGGSQYYHLLCAKAWQQARRDRLRGSRPKHLDAIAVRTTCKHGHPWTDPNVRVTPAGSKICRVCERIRP